MRIETTPSRLVLFADDDASLHELMRAALRRYGFEVQGVCNGRDAIEAFRRRQHHVLIVDLMMPKMNGYEFLREVRSMDPDALERTIVLTGASRDTWEWFDQESVAAFLTKPANLDLLGVLVSRLADTKSSAQGGG